MTAPAFVDLVDLASERLGAAAVEANDEFFGPKDNLLKPGPAVWREGVYTERGKWMDGWETRRRRDLGTHDFCVVRLGVPGIVRGVDVDTSFFRGNYPESCAIDIADAPDSSRTQDPADVEWREILPRSPLQGDSHNFFAIEAASRAMFVRLRIFPDGGVARLRVYGTVIADWPRLAQQGDVDLAAVEHGGLVVACSDMFFGSRHNLIMPGDATHMGDGWETKRRRGPGHDWTVIRLGAAGLVRRAIVDTRHFKGNAPGSCSIEGCESGDDRVQGADVVWRDILSRTPLQPHTRHEFEHEIADAGNVTHVRFNIYPDGGVGRLRLYGRPAARSA
jgi:allantoicase